MPKLVGVFEFPGPVKGVAGKLQGRGFRNLEIYSPAPFPELDDVLDSRPSLVRLFTLVGGLVGVVTGYAMTIWMSLDWPIMIGGKPFASIPPYTIIAFELTILFGGLLLLTPGFFTDLLGFSFLVPLTRDIWRKGLSDWLQKQVQQGSVTIHRM